MLVKLAIFPISSKYNWSKDKPSKESMALIHMNAGNGEYSYSNNSTVQKIVVLRTRRILEESIEDMMQNEKNLECYKMADLGCSSGPNSFLAISIVIDIIHDLCMKKRQKSPEFLASLNDLYENDFSTVFGSMRLFYEKIKIEKGGEFGPCFISVVAGSFYGRLFQSTSLHLVYSSYSLHWLSQVPEGIENNEGNIYISKTSPPNVFKEYLKQYKKDFLTFLRVRSFELLPNGHMVLTFLARTTSDPTSYDSCAWLKLLAKSLNDMVNEGLISEAKFHSFNVPLYAPYKDEVKAIIEEECSFTLNKMELFGVNWDASDNDCVDKNPVFDKYNSMKNATKTLRAVYEPLLANHFGFHNSNLMENLFERFEYYVGEHQEASESKFYTVVISLTKK